MVIPETWRGVVVKAVVHHITLYVCIVPVAVASEGRPQEGLVQGRIEHLLLTLGSALDTDA